MSFFLENIDQLWLPFAGFLLVLGGVTVAATVIWSRRKVADLESRAEKRTQRTIKEREVLEKSNLLDEKRQWHETRSIQEKELSSKRHTLEEQEHEFATRDKELMQRFEGFSAKENRFQVREEELNQMGDRVKVQEERLSKISSEYRSRLETLAKLSSDEARRQLFDELIQDVKQEAQFQVREIMEGARENATKEAKKIIALAIDRCAVDQSTQSSIAVVPLPNDQIKARIIGKDGRNIRTFEAASEVKVMVDDTPEAVVISCFDPIRREIGRVAMLELVTSGKITQPRIEEVIAKAREEIEVRILEEGKKTVAELKLAPMHPEIMKLLGRLQFRSSYGQNALEHSKEVAYLTGMMAVELGLDESLARRCGLLHDVGKALDHEMEGSHPEIGLAYAQRYGEPIEVHNAIVAHHNDENEEIISPITFLVSAADAISGARPGARRNNPEEYVKRVIALEELARSFEGVEDAYAISAGREIRVMVRPENVDDANTHVLAYEIAQKIRNDLTYPGHIKVTVIRGKIVQSWTNQPEGPAQRTTQKRRSLGRNRHNRPSRPPGGQAAAG